jgi:two-component system alkaline phosphatase synthesis response regulator PhoP
VADRIGADLTGLGYRVIAGSPGAAAGGSGSSPAVVLVSVDPTGERARAASAELRKDGPGERVPVVWLVERDRLDVLSGNEALFDEFVEVPTTSAALAARLRIVRHRHGVEGPEVLRRGPVRLHLATYRASADGRRIELTGKEFELLRFLMLDAGRVFSRPLILDRIWGHDYDGGMRTVDIHVWRLRAKLGERGALIETVRGVGYRFSPRTS